MSPDTALLQIIPRAVCVEGLTEYWRSVCVLPCPQARKQAEAIEVSVRMDRLQAQAGGSMVTTNTLASMDEDDETALKRLNLILKARAQPWRDVINLRSPAPQTLRPCGDCGRASYRRRNVMVSLHWLLAQGCVRLCERVCMHQLCLSDWVGREVAERAGGSCWTC